jgi:hypothetical protein
MLLAVNIGRSRPWTEQLAGLALGAGENQHQAVRREEGGVQGECAGGPRFAGAAGAAEKHLAVLADEKLLLPGVGGEALRLQDDGGVEGHAHDLLRGHARIIGSEAGFGGGTANGV